MSRKKTRFTPTTHTLALEQRLLFDGAAAVAASDIASADNSIDVDKNSASTPQPAAIDNDSIQASARMTTFGSLSVEAESFDGTVSSIKNTSDDGTVTVGENDKAGAENTSTDILKDWEVSGDGNIQITVEFDSGKSDSGKGTLSGNTSDGLTYTGPASGAKDWLNSINYEYTGQSETGDIDHIILTVTDKNGTQTYKQQLDIAPQNDATQVDKNGKVIATVKEGGSITFDKVTANGEIGFTLEQWGINDPDNTAKQVIIKLETIPDPIQGQLVLERPGGQAVILAKGSTLSVADLQYLTYQHTGAQVLAGTPNQLIQFTIDDGAGGRLTEQRVYIQLEPVNQAPQVAGNITIVEGETNVSLGNGKPLVAKDRDGKNIVIITDRGNITGTDPDDSELTYTITSLPEYGTLSYNGTELTVGNISTTVITDLDKLTYSYPKGQEPSKLPTPGQVSFKMVAKDNGGGTETPLSSQEATITLTILENNDDPVLIKNEPQDYLALQTNGKVNDNSFIITPEMLSVSDVDSFEKNLVFKVTGLSDATDSRPGYFTVDGKRLDADRSFTMKDVTDGKVKYHLRTETADARTDSFTFIVIDSSTGLLFDAQGQASQRDGGIYIDGTPKAKLAENTFEVRVPAATPGSGGALPDLPPIAEDFTTTKSDMNLLEGQGTAPNTTGVTLTTEMLNTSDGVSNPDKIVYRLETVPGSGKLYLGDKALNQFDSFTQADIDSNKVTFKHDGGENFQDAFHFSVSNGYLSTTALTEFKISITPQNDTPTASQGAGVNVLEGEKIVINGGGLQHIVLSDSDAVADGEGLQYANENTLWFVVTELPQYGELTFNGTKITEVNKANIQILQSALDSGKLVYEHNGDEQFKDSFTIQPYDDQNVGTGKAITPTNQSSQGEAVKINITVAPVNDAPQVNIVRHLNDTSAGNNGLYEGGSAIIYGNTIPDGAAPPYGQLVFTDPDNDTDQIQFRVTTATQYGQLLLNGKSLSVGSIFTQADLDSGKVSYQHNGGQIHSDSFNYVVSDGDYTVNAEDDGGVTGPGQPPTPSTYVILVKPSNDKPELIFSSSNPVLVDGTDARNNIVPGIQVRDPDLPVGAEGKEKDIITVIVRIVDKNGEVLKSADNGGMDYSLSVTATTGLTGDSNSTASAGEFLRLTGSIADVNAALETLGVGFDADGNTKNYQLQVIVDDRINAAGTAYQNGNNGTDAQANGGDKNQKDKQLSAIDQNNYDWSSVNLQTNTSIKNSLNIASNNVDLWISTINQEPTTFDVPTGPINVIEDVPSKVTGPGFQLSDPESEVFGTYVEVTLEVNDGKLLEARGAEAANITVHESGKSGDGYKLVLRGTSDDLNAYLSSNNAGTGVFYTSRDNVNHDTNGAADGDVSLKVTFEEGEANLNDPAAGGSAIGGDIGNGSQANAPLVKTVALTIQAVNDAPTVTAPAGKLTIDSNLPVSTGTFTLVDVDSDNGYATGESDGIIKVVVRIKNADGTPLANSTDYQGVNFTSTGAQGNLAVEGGSNAPLVLYGTKAEIQEYLNNLEVQFDPSGNAANDLNGRRYLEVLVDDRIYAQDNSNVWQLTQAANGGTVNQNGTDTPTAISSTTWDAYTDNATLDGIYNVASNAREMFISTTNDPAEIGFTGNLTGLERNESGTTVTLDGIKITDVDAEDNSLTVTITLPDGFTFATGAGHDSHGGTISGGGKTITLTGNLTELNSQFAKIHVNLPDVDGAGAIQAEDWNGSFTFNVEVNDHGNTGITDSNAPDDKNGNTFEVKEEGGKNVLVSQRNITLTVHPTNDAPVALDSGAGATLPTVEEDFRGTGSPANDAKTVDNLIGQFFDDSRDDIRANQIDGADTDTGSSKDQFWGIAITGNAATAGQGEWQYWDTANKNWVKVASVTKGNALLLSKDTVLQFVPIADWNGTPGKLTMHLVETNDNGDTTTTQADAIAHGAHINLTAANSTGGTSRVSSNTVALGTQVTAVNDAPVAQNDTHAISENGNTIQGGLITQPAGANKGVTGVDSDVDSDPALNANPGAEQISVTEVTHGSAIGNRDDATGNIVIKGTYGDLTVNKDGSYTYQLDKKNPEVNRLLTGETLLETFGYTISDNDNETASATLTITINGDNDSSSIVPKDINGANVAGHVTVNEKDLIGGSDNTTARNKAVTSGTIDITAGNGLSSITLGSGEDAETLTLEQLQAINPINSLTYHKIILDHGTLTITGFTPAEAGYDVPVKGTISYTYLLTTPQVQTEAGTGTIDVALQVTDVRDRSSTGTLTINVVDDVPIAKNDQATVTHDTTITTGNVLKGGSATDVADILGADGALVSAITGEDGVPVPLSTPSVTVDGVYGTLTINRDGSYIYTRFNDAATPGPVTDAFKYQITDGDGDSSSATLTVHIDDKGPSITDGEGNPPTEVPGSGTDKQLVIKAAGSVKESGLPNGSSPNAGNTTTTGNVILVPGDGLKTVSITPPNGTPVELVSGVSKTITTHSGTATVTYTQGTGSDPSTLTYQYILTEATRGDATTDEFAITVTDDDGDTSTVIALIDIIDDVPEARDDVATVNNNSNTATGNVIAGGNPTDVADIQGADGARVSSVIGADNNPVTFSDPDAPITVNGEYGILTIERDGSYTYTRTDSTPTNGTIQDTFEYQITDGDGDTSSATLTININDKAPSITDAEGNPPTEVSGSGTDKQLVIKAAGSVKESGLPNGSSPNAGNTTTTGNVILVPGDGLKTVSVTPPGGTPVELVSGEPQTITTASGTATVTYTQGTGSDPSTLTYEYTLTKATSGQDTDEFAITVTDNDGDATTVTALITIEDDTPTAKDDIATVNNNSNTAIGNVIAGGNPTDVADTQGADGASVSAITGKGGLPVPLSDSNSPVTVQGEHGTLTISQDGSYTYTRTDNTPTNGVIKDTFEYQITDGDGDSDTATLTINIDDKAPSVTDGKGLPPTLEPVPGTEDSRLVFKADGPVNESGLQNGSNPGTGHTTSGSFILTPGDGQHTVTITPPGGTPVTLVPGGSETITTRSGTVTVTYTQDPESGKPLLTYEYTLTQATTDVPNQPETDEFTVTVTDEDGDTTTATALIEIIDDVPVARDDIATVNNNSNTASGNVIAGGNPTDVADTQGADGASVSAITGKDGLPVALSDSNSPVTVQGDHGTLTISQDGSYTYTRTDNTPTNGVIKETFEYQITDGDGDSDTATLTINIDDKAPSVTDGKGLPPTLEPVPGTEDSRLVFKADGPVNESGLQNGSNPGTGHTTTGSFTLTPGDGQQTVTVTPPGGTPVELVSGVPQTITTASGTVTVTYTEGSESDKPTLTYVYTLTQATTDQPDQPETDEFTVTVTDEDGDTTTATALIEIIDDVPVARDDIATVNNNSNEATGNVLTGGNPTDVADTQGADGASVSAITGKDGLPVALSDSNSPVTVQGEHGTLTISQDGSYTYTRTDNTPTNGVIKETFEYQITDGDGDSDTATLTINIDDKAPSVTDGKGLPPTLEPVPGTEDSRLVFKADGPVNESGLPTGSNPGTGHTTTGSFTLTPGDGQQTVTVTPPGGTPVKLVSGEPQTITTASGTVTVTYTQGTESDKPTLTYVYTLTQATTDVPNQPETDEFTVTVTDEDGDTTTATALIEIIDDVPTARDDIATVNNNSNEATGNVLTGGNPTDVADTQGADGTSVSAITGKDGLPVALSDSNSPVTVQGEYGILTISQDGSYTYTRTDGSPTSGLITDVFTYQITDGDGDTDTAILTINIDNKAPSVTDGKDLPPTLEPIPGTEDSRLVFKADGPVNESGLPNGSNPGTGHTTTGSFTLTPGDGQQTVTITPPGGTPVTLVPGGSETITTASGTVTVTYTQGTESDKPTLTYVYTLTKPTTDVPNQPETDEFTVTVTDADGDKTTATALIEIIDDVPEARDDIATVNNNSNKATGNVLTGGNPTDVADTKGADGAVVSHITGADGEKVPLPEGGLSAIVTGQYGTLTIGQDGSYTYTRFDGAPTNGPVSDVFTYQITDGDGDTDTATLTININDQQPSITDGKGNPPVLEPVPGTEDSRLVFKADGPVNESGLPNGSNPGTGHTTTGSFTLTPGDGQQTVTVTPPGGTPVKLVSGEPQTITTASGTVTVTYTQGTESDKPTLTYVYTLTKPTTDQPDQPETDEFTVTVTDEDGDTTTATALIEIIDDVPVARDDIATVNNNSNTASGNVIAGGNPTDVADTQGADGASVSAITGKDGLPVALSDSSSPVTVQGEHGILTISQDGSYTYTRTDNTPTNGVIKETFEYRITDGDGDSDTATLTININDQQPSITDGKGNPPVLEPVPGTEDSRLVFKADGPVNESGLPNGSNPGTGHTTTGSFTLTPGDGQQTVTVTPPGGTPVKLVSGEPQTITTASGTVTVTYTQGTESDKPTLTYVYTLTQATIDQPDQPETDEFTVTVTDEDGDTTTATALIEIIDDVPTARDDIATVNNNSNKATGNVLTGGNPTDVADTKGADGAVVSHITRADGEKVPLPEGGLSAIVTGQYGTLTIGQDGSYTYTRFDGAPTNGPVSDVFTYQITDGDGDTDTATLTININDKQPSVTDGQGNPPVLEPVPGTEDSRLVFKADGPVNESGLPNGSNPGTGHTTTGTLTLTPGDGQQTVTVTPPGGTPVTLVPGGSETITTRSGTVTVTWTQDPESGKSTLSYEYTLTQPTTDQPDQPETDEFTVTVTDADGDTTTATALIEIIDDVPVARDDIATVDNGSNKATGNVIAGGNPTDVADTRGADGASVSAITGKDGQPVNLSDSPVSVSGQYGTLTINHDGSYVYTRFDGTPTNGPVSDVFTYQITDGDGDTDTATLTININDQQPSITDGKGNPPVLEPVPGTEDSRLVFKADGPVNESGLPNGSNPGTGHTTTGTLTLTPGDGQQTVTVTPPGGTPVELVSGIPQTITTASGTVTVTYTEGTESDKPTLTYEYTLTKPVTDLPNQPETDEFTVTVTDEDGDKTTVTALIEILDDVPVARDDIATVDNGSNTATGNVIAGGNPTDVADTQGADGAFVSAITGKDGLPVTLSDSNSPVTVQGEHGTLTISQDGSYTYTRTDGSPTDGPIADIFTYQITDGDGDTDTATLTININDQQPSITDGKGNPPVLEPVPGTEDSRLVFKADGPVNESGLQNGSNPGTGHTTTGTLTLTPGDGQQTVTVTPPGGTPVKLVSGEPQTITTTSGTVTVTYTSGSESTPPTLTYVYTLTQPTTDLPDQPETDEFTVTVTDADGDTTTATALIEILDDVPVARDDIATVDNGSNKATGNVIAGGNPTDVADTRGADGASVSAITGKDGQPVNLSDSPVSVSGQYGTLTINHDGSYVYTRFDGAPTNGPVSDVFTYQITDGDGDTDTATLTININDQQPSITDGKGNPPVLEPVPGTEDSRLVFKADGPVNESGLPNGSNPGTGHTTTGSFTLTPGDGQQTVTVTPPGGTPVELVSGIPQTITTASGTVTVTYTEGTESDKPTLTYEYTLTKPVTDLPNQPETDEFTVTVTDADGDTTTATALIEILDDVPVARDDIATVDNGSNTATGNVIAGGNPTDVADTQGADGASVSAITGKDGLPVALSDTPVIVNGEYGTLTINRDGSYIYTRFNDAATPGAVTDVFTYQITDGDGDSSTATLTVNIDDKQPSITDGNGNPPTSKPIPGTPDSQLVFKADGQVLESGLPEGSNPGTGHTTTGTLILAPGDGLKTVTITPPGGSAIELVSGIPQTFTTASGTVTVTYTEGTESAKPTITYLYELKTATSGQSETDEFTVTVIDEDGDTSTATALIEIINDVPEAQDDVAVVDNNTNTAAGNALNNDTLGADREVLVTDLSGANTQGQKDPITGEIRATGQYGVLVIQADGSYIYTRNNSAATDGAVTDRFTYTITDADGDSAEATITISINRPVPSTNYTPPTSQPTDFVTVRPLRDPPTGLVTGDTTYVPSVFFDYSTWTRVLRVDAPMHPVIYVGPAVRDSQEMQSALLRSNNVPVIEIQATSIGGRLGQADTTHIHQVIGESQQATSLLARISPDLQPDLPHQTPESESTVTSEGDTPESSSTEGQPETTEPNAETPTSADLSDEEPIAFWWQENTQHLKVETEIQPKTVAGSFSEQLETQSDQLPVRLPA